MKILMVSAGLRPKRTGGLVAYVEEIIDELINRGHEIVYLDMSGIDASIRLHITEEHKRYKCYTIYNSGVYIGNLLGTFEPTKQIYPSEQLRYALDQIVETENPDVIHLHELIGFPVAYLEVLMKRQRATLFTAQDYFAVCPTIKLFTYEEKVCRAPASELTCDKCCAGANYYFSEHIARQIQGFTNHLGGSTLHSRLKDIIHKKSIKVHQVNSNRDDYIHRRNEFVKYLRCLGAIICMSKTQYAVLDDKLEQPSNLRHINLSRKTYKLPATNKKQKAGGGKRIFIALNIYGVAKGRVFLEDAFSHIAKQASNWELHIYGDQGCSNDYIKFFPSYNETDLDYIASSADYGIIPSLWQEAYGYVGPELLTRGVPLIVSSRGAMTEYVKHGTNGWIYSPDDETELPVLLKGIISGELSLDKQNLSKIAFPMFDEHIVEMESIYEEIVNSDGGKCVNVSDHRCQNYI